MVTPRGTARDLRRRNRSAVLRRLLFVGPASRAELSHDTGLSLATVGNVTGELVADRLVVEAGLLTSDGGRPRVLLRVDPGYCALVGVDVGDRTVTADLFDLGLRRLASAELPIGAPARAASAVGPLVSSVAGPAVGSDAAPSGAGSGGQPDPAVVAATVAAALDRVTAAAGVDEGRVLGVGVAVPGAVEQGQRALVHAQVIGWNAVPFEELLRAAGVRAPLYFDNVAKTQAQAEMWFGAGRGARHAVIALVCSGVGAAVVVGGTTYQGATSSAGEWGHTTIAYGGRLCRCGARGCLEAYVGAEAILDRYRRARGGRPAAGTDEHSQLAALIDAAPRSPVAARVLAETAGYLGAGLANLVNLFNPERIVVAGWAGVALGRALLPEIRAHTAAYALGHAYQQTTVRIGELGADSVAFSAATLPLGALLAHGGDPRGDRRRARVRTGEVTAA